MRMNRIAMWALLAGLVAGTAQGQAQPNYGPPGSQGQPGQDWRQPSDPYDRQPEYGYDRDQSPSVDVGFFYNELSPYGEWVRHPYYGWVWFPRHVRAGWRPYSLGRWVESDYGWMWVSEEPFGWATYHYGRWAWDPYLGWLWVPGTDWGPAWVAWQQGNGYVGWAPLPPAVGFDLSFGIRIGGLSLGFGIAPRNYAFVEERRFLDSRIDGYIVPEARNITIINNTVNITNYTIVDNRVINHGVPVERIERAAGRRAQRLRVATVSSPRGAGVQRDVITIYKPTRTNLETVRVGRRNNAGLPVAPPEAIQPVGPGPTSRQPGVAPSGPRIAPVVPIPVAPRAKPARPQADERQFQREEKDLKAKLDKEQRALDQLHRQEKAQAVRAKANAEEMAQRHAAEVKEQQELRRRAAEQLQVRQQIERRAAEASPAEGKPGKPAGKPAKPGKPGKPDKPKNEKPTEDQKPPRSF